MTLYNENFLFYNPSIKINNLLKVLFSIAVLLLSETSLTIQIVQNTKLNNERDQIFENSNLNNKKKLVNHILSEINDKTPLPTLHLPQNNNVWIDEFIRFNVSCDVELCTCLYTLVSSEDSGETIVPSENGDGKAYTKSVSCTDMYEIEMKEKGQFSFGLISKSSLYSNESNLVRATLYRYEHGAQPMVFVDGRDISNYSEIIEFKKPIDILVINENCNFQYHILDGLLDEEFIELKISTIDWTNMPIYIPKLLVGITKQLNKKSTIIIKSVVSDPFVIPNSNAYKIIRVSFEEQKSFLWIILVSLGGGIISLIFCIISCFSIYLFIGCCVTIVKVNQKKENNDFVTFFEYELNQSNPKMEENWEELNTYRIPILKDESQL